MKKIIIIPTLTILLFLSSCKKDKLSGDDKNAIGTWTWVGSECDCCELPSNPTVVGYSLKLTLTEKGTYTLYKNDKKIEHGRLIKSNGVYTFNHNDIKRKDDVLNGLKIIYTNQDTLKIDAGVCGDKNYILYIRQ